MNLNDPIEKLPFVGNIYGKRLQKLEIFTIEDLLLHFPFRYDDFSLISPINRVQAGETVTVRGVIEKITNSYTKSGKKIQKAVIADGSGKIYAVWFNQPFLIKTLRMNETYNFSGKVDWFGRELSFVSPEYEISKTETTAHCSLETNDLNAIHTGRLVPVYNETYGVSSKWLRSRIKLALQSLIDEVKEFLPKTIIEKESLMDEKKALFQIHFPEDKIMSEKARRRLAFDELFLIQLASLQRKKDWEEKEVGKAFRIDNLKIFEFINSLTFTLTGAQKRVIGEILNDLGKTHPMNRLLEGDVGSGKTVVAAIAAYVAFLNDRQTLFMAPTEILASQHYSTLKTLLEPMGIPVELITGTHKHDSKTQDAKRNLSTSSGQVPSADRQKSKPGIVVGTHALLYQDFDCENIGLVIVDEQHRFGVEQRALLSKKGKRPHFLTMTATPIPRTIALTLFGDLDLSVIDEMPLGRLKVKTWVVPKEKRQNAYGWVRERIKNTPEQSFIICPLIEESETMGTIRAATVEFETLRKSIFPDLRLGLLHGRMKAKDKDETLIKFKDGHLDILVATPVVEVGIDIPNATIMIVEAADRFGLAQLHQLRGRVGRREIQSYCLLFTENENPQVVNRLKALEKTNIGMELSEIDLRMRGPGEVYGTRQHGFADLKVASFSDLDLIQKTRQAASETITANLKELNNKDSLLQEKLKKYKIEPVTN